MDHNRHLPQAHVVTEVETGDIENGDPRCPNDAILVVETARRSGGKGRVWLLILTVLLLIGLGLAQALLASDIKKLGIRVLDSWAFGNSYPTAGAPSVGFLSVSIGALYFFISLLAIFAGDKRQGLIVTAAVSAALSSLVLFLISFGELAVYIALSVNHDCMANIESELTSRGDCICWAGDISGGDLVSKIRSGEQVDFVYVDIASAEGISCDRILYSLDDIRTSYLLMAACIGVLMITAIILLVRLQRRDRGQEEMEQTADTAVPALFVRQE